MLTLESRPDEAVGQVLADVELEPEGRRRAGAVIGRCRSRVLVVDDEPVNVQALVNFLTLAKYDVVTAADGKRRLTI